MLQRCVVDYIGLVLAPEVFFFHTLSGGGRSKAEAGIFKAMGVKPGVHDLIFMWPERNLLSIELKASKDASITPGQWGFAEVIEECGWEYAICASLDDVVAALVCNDVPVRIRIIPQ